MKKSLKQRFDEKWIPEPNTGCWLWTGAEQPPRGSSVSGYGLMNLSRVYGRNYFAHQVAMHVYKGYPLDMTSRPSKYVWDHLCRVRACVNPDHIELVTHQTNILRGEGLAATAIKQTHCKHGHELSGDNVRIVYKPHKQRLCRACRRRISSEWSRKKRVKRGWEGTELGLPPP